MELYVATPSQQAVGLIRRERLRRMALHAKPQCEARMIKPAATAPTAADLAALRAEQERQKVAAWVKRQKEAGPYKAWFSVVSVTNPGISVNDIQRACAKHYGVSVTDIVAHRRTAVVVRPRQVAAYLCRKMTVRSLPDIGRKFGDRDHTTILHASRKIEALIQTDATLAEAVVSIVVRLTSGRGR